ncbi:MAG: hypothetical protein Q4Q17_05750, partial [Tissierellia bacterium]|nr:hypothetical protein [Tissierellia bacterium]
MHSRKLLAIIMTIAMVVGFIPQQAKAGGLESEAQMTYWPLPEAYVLESNMIRQEGMSFEKVDASNRTIFIKATTRSAISDPRLEWIYLRLDKALEPYIEEISMKNKATLGVRITYERYFEKVTPQTKARLTTTRGERKETLYDSYSQMTDQLIYKVPHHIGGARPPFAKASRRFERIAGVGNWGVFPGLMLETERYEATIKIKLNRPVDEIIEELGRTEFIANWRSQGYDKDGKARITEASLQNNTIIDLSDQSVHINDSAWLKAPCTHNITAQLEGDIIGKDGAFSKELKGTGKTLIRIQNSIMNNLFYFNYYGMFFSRTSKQDVSFHVKVDPELLNHVENGDYVRVWQVYRESNIRGHDGNKNKAVFIPKEAFDNTGHVRIVVDPNKASKNSHGIYDPDFPGILFVSDAECFLNKTSSSPFIGANFVDIPVSSAAFAGDIPELYVFETWFSDVHKDEERRVKNSFASSAISARKIMVHMYRVNLENQFITEDFEVVSDKTMAHIKDVPTITFNLYPILSEDLLRTFETEDYTYVGSEPEVIDIDVHDVDGFYLPVIIPADDDDEVPEGYVEVRFKEGEHGMFAPDQHTRFFVKEGFYFEEEYAPAIMADEGYIHAGWEPTLPMVICEKCNLFVAQYMEQSRKPENLRQEGNSLLADVEVTPETPILPGTNVVLKDEEGNILEASGTIDEGGNIVIDVTEIEDGTIVVIELQEPGKEPAISEPFEIVKVRPNKPSLIVPTVQEDDIVIGELVGDVEFVHMTISNGDDVEFTLKDG